MKRWIKSILAATTVTALVATTALAGKPSSLEGKWVSGDFHQHSYVTDGGNPMPVVLQNGFDFGLDWQANSEHGGTSDQEGINGDPWNEVLEVDDFLGDPNPAPNLWRWQTLADPDKVPAYLDMVREANPDKIVINGMEMNMPGAFFGGPGIE